MRHKFARQFSVYIQAPNFTDIPQIRLVMENEDGRSVPTFHTFYALLPRDT